MSGPLFDWGDALRAGKVRRAKFNRRVVALGIFVGLTLSPAIFPPLPRLVWNASASAPIGLYFVSPDVPADPGDMVIARVPQPWRDLAARRHYLPANVPLVKRVAAAAGDDMCAFGQEIFINGRWVTGRRVTDAKGRSMPMWSGCTRLRGRKLLAVSMAAFFSIRHSPSPEALVAATPESGCFASRNYSAPCTLTTRRSPAPMPCRRST